MTLRIRIILAAFFSGLMLYAQSPEPNAPDFTDFDPNPKEIHSGSNYHPDIALYMSPWVFSGYRSLSVFKPKFASDFPDKSIARDVIYELDRNQRLKELERERKAIDSILTENPDSIDLLLWDPYTSISAREENIIIPQPPIVKGNIVPQWLINAMENMDYQEDMIYTLMVEKPSNIQYAYWDLPAPPRLKEEDYSFTGYLKRLHLPTDDIAEYKISEVGLLGRYNWLHNFNTALQLSQAYVSKNWYQGGNSYLAFLFNFLWDVQLNQAYYPNTLFQSTLAYKFSINSTPDDQYHKYSVSQDIFQYNLKAGYRAAHNWYYSYLLQFKTQFFNSYPSNSEIKSASFLSPAELNMGLGMTYNKETSDQRIKFTASISPLSYNLKICIDPDVEHSQFGIRSDRRWVNEIGSNAEITLQWNIWTNISYATRLFLFSDYKSFQGDWENTFNFQFNRYFSTQLYFHLRYDSQSERSIAPKWNKWMMKEILSVGISYSFSTANN